MMSLSVVVFTCLLCGDFASGYTYTVDMEKSSVCNTASEHKISPYDVASIYAEPLPVSTPTRASCQVKFTSTNGDGFKIYVRDLFFGECQVYIKIYEDLYLNNARYAFGCDTNQGGLYRTMASTIIVRLEKPGPESHNYKFFLRLALNDGMDIGGEEGGGTVPDTEAVSAGALAGIIVAALIGAGVAIAVIIYCIITWRKRQEEKEAERSVSTLFPPVKTDTDHHDGSSVHSSAHVSWHSSKVPSENPAYNYPAYRTQMSVSENVPKCHSIDSKSYDSENTDGSKLIKDEKPKGKSAKKELDSLRRTIFRIEMDKERDKEEELRYLERERDRQDHYDQGYHADRQGHSSRSGRHTGDRPILNAANIKESLRSAREKGRSFGSDSNVHRGSRKSLTSRSKSKGRSHSPASSRDWDRYSDRHENRSRRDHHDSRERSRSGHRSSSGPSRRNREDRDYYSDYDYETRDSRDRRSGHYRDRDRDAYSEDYSDDERYSHRSYRSEGHRARSGSEGHRTRSGSTGRRRR